MGESSTFYRHKIGADQDPPWMLSFCDVIVEPKHTAYDITRVTPDMSAQIGPCTLKYPYLSAAMDKVTGVDMAIAMARQGGLGVLHRNHPAPVLLSRQLEMVKKVKKSRSNMVTEVAVVHPTDSIEYAKRIMEENNISGLVVVDPDNTFAGMFTKRDARIPACLDGTIKTVADAMTPAAKAVWSYEGISEQEAEKKMYLNGRVEKLPILNKDKKVAGVMTLKDLHIEYPNASVDKQGRLLCGLAVSPFMPKESEGIELFKEITKYVDLFFTDVADHDKEPDVEGARGLMEEFNGKFVIGNIGTYEAMEFLITNARFPEDKWVGVKVGMGSGSICITTKNTGFGAPTLYATACVADAIKDYGLEGKLALIADGGFEELGDFVKPFVIGATAVMAGRFYAGTTESPGYIDTRDGRKVKTYWGMGSTEARAAGSIGDRYSNNGKGIAEGVSAYVPYVGDLKLVFKDQVSALTQGMGYGGAEKLSDLRACRFGRGTYASGSTGGAHAHLIK